MEYIHPLSISIACLGLCWMGKQLFDCVVELDERVEKLEDKSE